MVSNCPRHVLPYETPRRNRLGAGADLKGPGAGNSPGTPKQPPHAWGCGVPGSPLPDHFGVPGVVWGCVCDTLPAQCSASTGLGLGKSSAAAGHGREKDVQKQLLNFLPLLLKVQTFLLLFFYFIYLFIYFCF